VDGIRGGLRTVANVSGVAELCQELGAAMEIFGRCRVFESREVGVAVAREDATLASQNGSIVAGPSRQSVRVERGRGAIRVRVALRV
jgi:hypothetical protein